MDLGAYVQIEDLGSIAKANGILVPRLRGYRLMSDETEELKTSREEVEKKVVGELIHSSPFWKYDSGVFKYDYWTSCLEKYYMPNGNVDWSKIHGWKRREAKFAVKKELRKYRARNEVWNKYLGKNDVLYVHARIGGYNWNYYKEEVIHNPRFIEKVDDPLDSTYCDLYFKIDREVCEA